MRRRVSAWEGETVLVLLGDLMYLTQKWSVKIKTFLRRFWLKRQRNGTV